MATHTIYVCVYIDSLRYADFSSDCRNPLCSLQCVQSVMHMSILNALPASMTLAPLNDANNGRQGAVGGGNCYVHGHAPSTSAAPSQLILPHYATLNELNIFEH